MNPESYPGTTESAYMRARMERGMEGGGFVCGNFMPPQESLVGWLAVPLLLVKTAAWAATHSHLRGQRVGENLFKWKSKRSWP